MRSSLLAVVVGFLFSSVVWCAELNLTEVAANTPRCASICSVLLLDAAHCPLPDMRDCLCTNITLQHSLFSCVLSACNLTEQVSATLVSQNLICNGVDSPSRSAEIIRIVVIISAFTFTFMGLRLFSRYTLAKLWWDDWLIVVSLVCMIPMTVIPILNATKGFGTHAWTVPPQNITLLRQLYYASQIFYVIVQNLAKIAILLLYLRIFPTPRFRLATKITLVWQTCHFLAFLMAVTLQCVPVDSIWNLKKEGKCVNSTGLVYAGAVLSIVEDIVIIALPIPELRGLNLSLRKRIALILMFALGSFACVTSMVRLKYIISFTTNSLDSTWDNIDVIIWSTIEVYTAMICASLMSIRPLLVKYFPTLFPTTAAHDYSHTASWRPKESNTMSGRIWGAGGSEVELKSRDDSKGDDGDGRGNIKVRTDFEITETTLDDASGSDIAVDENAAHDMKASTVRSV